MVPPKGRGRKGGAGRPADVSVTANWYLILKRLIISLKQGPHAYYLKDQFSSPRSSWLHCYGADGHDGDHCHSGEFGFGGRV